MISPRTLLTLIVIPLALVGCTPASSPTHEPTATTHPDIHVTEPLVNAVVKSPLTVRGEARGNWYFEASFPVRLVDDQAHVIAVAPAQAKGDWMTDKFVPFEVTLPAFTTTAKRGTLILEKDNPSGMPEHAAMITIPVQF